jgi:hypothetical protein
MSGLQNQIKKEFIENMPDFMIKILILARNLGIHYNIYLFSEYLKQKV